MSSFYEGESDEEVWLVRYLLIGAAVVFALLYLIRYFARVYGV